MSDRWEDKVRKLVGEWGNKPGIDVEKLIAAHAALLRSVAEDARREEAAALLELCDEDTGCCVSVGGALFVNCNDFFVPAADGEDVNPEDMAPLLAAHRADPKLGAMRWVAEKRGIPFKRWRDRG